MKHLKSMYGVDPKNKATYKYNPDVGRVINDMTIDRLYKMIDESGGKVIVGGIETIDRDQRYICPTIIQQPRLDSKIMTEEVFGPVLPVLTYKNFDELINIHIKSKGKPLAIYYAGNSSSENFQRLVDETSSGNVSSNDSLTYAAYADVGFGGVGFSGIGRIGGYEAFK